LIVGEDPLRDRALVRFESVPFGGGFEPVEMKDRTRPQPPKPRLPALFDSKVTPNGKVDERGGDVPKVRRIVDECAELRRGQCIGWFVADGNRPKLRIAAQPVPEVPHQTQDTDRETQRPVRPEKQAGELQRTRLDDEALIPAHHGSESLAKSERAGHLKKNLRAGDLYVRLFLSRAVSSAERQGLHASRAGGHQDSGCRRFDRYFPFVTRHVPIEFIVVVEVLEPVRDLVGEDLRLRRIVGTR
jgi:hypothetical protein